MSEPLTPIEHVLVPIPSDHVLIQVPKDRIREVVALLESVPELTGREDAFPDPRLREDVPSKTRRVNEPASATTGASWSPGELKALVDDGLQPKQLVFLELLLEHAGEAVYTDAARRRLEHSGLLGNTAYSGKALGGVVLSLKRRANWYNDRVPLFDVVWDRDAWMNTYRLPTSHAEPLGAAIADGGSRTRNERT